MDTNFGNLTRTPVVKVVTVNYGQHISNGEWVCRMESFRNYKGYYMLRFKYNSCCHFLGFDQFHLKKHILIIL